MADEEVGFAAEMVEHACHFDGDVSCAYEGDFLWSLLKVEEAVGGDAEFAAWDVLGYVWVAAGGE